MGATTLEVRIRPRSEISKQLATRRAAMRVARERTRRLRFTVRTAELEAACVPAVQELAEFIARRDAVARYATPYELATADAALRHAICTCKLAGLHDAISRLEHVVETSLMIRTRQLLVLDQVARRLPTWLCIEAVVRGRDNVTRMYARLNDGREAVIAARADTAEEHVQTLDVELTHSYCDRAVPESDADAAVICASLRKHLCSQGMEVTADAGALTGPDATATSAAAREKAVELSLAVVGFTMSAAGFPTEWQFGEYMGVVLTALATGMLLARHFRDR